MRTGFVPNSHRPCVAFGQLALIGVQSALKKSVASNELSATEFLGNLILQ